MAKYRKKPIVVDAVQLVEGCRENMAKLIRRAIPVRLGNDKKLFMLIPTLEGEKKAEEGDWIIKDDAGEFSSCEPDVFQETYEKV